MIDTNQNGFTLIEVMAVIFVITVGVTGVYSLLEVTMSSSNLVSQKLTATYLAQEGVEIVRGIRDSNWLQKRRNPDQNIYWDDHFPSETVGPKNYIVSYKDLEEKDPDLRTYTSSSYLEVNEKGRYGYFADGENTPFKRKVTLENEGEKIKVKVTVSFTYQGKDHSIKVEENLYKWRSTTSP